MQFRDVKKRLMFESGVIAVVLVVLGLAVYGVMLLKDGFEQENKNMASQFSATSSELNTLRDKYTKFQQNGELYQEVLLKNANDELSLSRQVIRKKFDEFKDRFYLSNLRMTMGPVQEMQGNKYKRNSHVVIASEVGFQFDALSDEDIYSLMQTIQNELPGTARVTKFMIERKSMVTPSILSDISQNGTAPVVSGEVNFLWFGMKPVEVGGDVNASAKK